MIYQRKTLDFDKNTFIRLMGLAVKNVVFQSAGLWYKQADGLAMGSKLAVCLLNIWLRQFDPYFGGSLREEEEIEPSSPINEGSKHHCCSKCGKMVTRKGYSAQCNRCRYWYHRAYTGMSTAKMRFIKPGQWHCE